MRLLRQINERLSPEEKYKREHGVSFDDIIETLQRDCKKFISEIKSGGVVYRGSSNKIKPLDPIQARKGARIPRNTDKKVHTHFNKLFKEKFGWPARNGVFATGDYAQTILYGNAYYFFPIGNFKFVYSTKHKDLFNHSITSVPVGMNDRDFIKTKKRTFTTIMNTYTDKDLSRGILLGTEISFKCSKYYMIPEDAHLWEYMGNMMGTPR